MATNEALVWDVDGERLYETGVKNAALYLYNNSTKEFDTGYAWNGISAITESPSGAEANPVYADDMKYLNLFSVEEFGGTIEAYMYPPEFAACDGSATYGGVSVGQQERRLFGMAYKTTVGNDTEGNSYGYKHHLVYNQKASPSERAYNTINDSPEAIAFSWEFSTTPIPFSSTGEFKDLKATSILTIESTGYAGDKAQKLADLEAILYGVASEKYAVYAAETAYSVGTYLAVTGEGIEGLYRVKTAIDATDETFPAEKCDKISDNTNLVRLPKPEEVLAILGENTQG